MEIVASSADPPKPVEQNEEKQQDSDPPPPPSPPPKKEDPPKKTRKWKKIKNAFMRPSSKSSKANLKSDESSTTTGTEDELTESIESSINDLKKQAETLDKNTSESIKKRLDTLEGFFRSIETFDDKEKKKRLSDLQKDLIKLKLAVPSKEEARAEKKLSLDKLKFTTVEEERSRFDRILKDRMPKLHSNPVFDKSMELKEFVARFDKLDNNRVKLCLLCLSVFPVGAVIKKRLLVQWWVADGYASTEEVANENFRLLMNKGFIEPVNENRSPTMGSCRVHPFNRLALVALASRARFFNFVEGGDPTQNFWGCYQACLMGEGLISYDEFTKWNEEKAKQSKKKKEGGNADEVIKDLTGELEKLHLLMNVDEHILEFKHEWFGKMRNVNVLHLGRWKVDATHHIEVEDKEFLEEGLKNMTCVKFLSLQGISNIISLPDSILSVANLNVLDLRACYNLETIPEKIGRYLERLTHLDMSECYLLEHMPKSLKMLKKLKVLKGFFVGKRERAQCMLGDLVELKELEKLCLYTNTREFPTNEDVKDLQKLENLSKLTITWGVGELSGDEDSDSKKQESSSNEEAKIEVDKPTSQKNSKKQDSSSTEEAEAKAEAEADKLPTILKNSKKQESSSNEGTGEEAEAEAEAETGKLPTSEKNPKKPESSSNEETEAAKLPTNEEAEAKAKEKAKEEAGKLSADQKNSKKQESTSNEVAKAKKEVGKLPASLKKLDLKCFPMSKTPDWLKLENLKHTELEKLHIRGGKFSDVGQYGADETWKVKVLRLKYLSEIEMEWRRLQELFPKLEYLEQVECPKLTFFPCDAKGVWINPKSN